MSIKNKLVTAVTTAGLLAGLFGSAFVPAANGAGRIGGSGTVSAGQSTIQSVTVDTDTDGAGADTLEAAELRTTVLSNDDGTRNTGTKDFFMDYEDAAKAAGVAVPDDTQVILYTLNTAAGAAVTALTELKATSSSTVIDLAWMYNDDGTEGDNCEDDDLGVVTDNWTSSDTVEGISDDSAGNGFYYLCVYPNRAGKATITVVADGVTLPAVTITVFGDLASLTLSVRNGHNYIASGNAKVDRYFRIVGKDSLGQVLNGAGSGAYSALGDLADFNLTESANNPLFANDTSSNFITNTEFEAWAGNDYAAYYENGEDSDFEFGFSKNDWDLNASACLTADEGKSYAIAIEAVNYDGDTIESNTVTITCTGDEAKVTDLSVEATTGLKTYSETGSLNDGVLSIWATIVDQDGRPMGVGVENLDFEVAFDGDASLDQTVVTVANTDFYGSTNNGVALGNKVRVAYLEPAVARKAVYEYTISLSNADLGADDAVYYEETFTYTVSASVTEKVYNFTVKRNAAKTRATMSINFGVACSRVQVDIDIQLPSGVVNTVTRRANIDGVATLQLERRRSTIYVQAFCGDLESEVKTVRFR